MSVSDQKSSAKTKNQKSEYPVLFAIQGPLEGRRWEIKDDLIIGRDEDCDIRIDDRQVSRHHARVYASGVNMEVEDLASKNGTFHSGKQINENVVLQDGDIIQIAMIQKFAFYNSDATMPMEDFIPPIVGHESRMYLDEKSRRVWILGEELLPALSAPQFRLLAELIANQGKVVARNDLIHAIWEDEDAEGVSEQALDALIRRLRDRLASMDPGHEYIVTVRGHGLRLGDK